MINPLKAVALTLVLSVIGIVILALLERSIPDALQNIALAALGLMAPSPLRDALDASSGDAPVLRGGKHRRANGLVADEGVAGGRLGPGVAE